MFFSIYAKIDGVWLAPAWLEGREVIAVFESSLDTKPSYFMWLEWRGNEIAFIRDYNMCATSGERERTSSRVGGV